MFSKISVWLILLTLVTFLLRKAYPFNLELQPLLCLILLYFTAEHISFSSTASLLIYSQCLTIKSKYH